jgi:hypothetical protein
MRSLFFAKHGYEGNQGFLESFRVSEHQPVTRDLKREEIAAVLLILFFVLLVLVWIVTPMLPTLTGGYP